MGFPVDFEFWPEFDSELSDDADEPVDFPDDVDHLL